MSQPLSRRPSLIVFDLDGTLVDSAPDLHGAMVTTLLDDGLTAISLADARRFIGDGTRRFVERAYLAVDHPLADADLDRAAERFLANYRRRVAELTRPFDGVEETLRALRDSGVRLAVCTNKPEAAAEDLLGILGLRSLFEGIAGGDTFPVRKPDPGHLLGLLDHLGAVPADALMIGDNEHDAATARAAGVPVLLVPYGYARLPLEEIDADGVLASFSDLPSRLPKA